MELMQVQSQQLSYQQIQGLKLLQMSSWELEQYLRELSQENPLVDLEPETPSVEEKDELLHYLQWLEDNDYQNLYCQQVNEDELDPLSRVGGDPVPLFVPAALHHGPGGGTGRRGALSGLQSG